MVRATRPTFLRWLPANVGAHFGLICRGPVVANVSVKWPCAFAFRKHSGVHLVAIFGRRESFHLFKDSPDDTLQTTLLPDHQAPFSDIVCDHCGSERLVLVKTTEQPEWAKVLGYHSKSCPFWYDEIRAQDDEQFWDGAMGEGFNAWYLEYLIERARETEVPTRPRPPTHRQPLLPGMTLPSGYLLNSF